MCQTIVAQRLFIATESRRAGAGQLRQRQFMHRYAERSADYASLRRYNCGQSMHHDGESSGYASLRRSDSSERVYASIATARAGQTRIATRQRQHALRRRVCIATAKQGHRQSMHRAARAEQCIATVKQRRKPLNKSRIWPSTLPCSCSRK